MYNLENDHYKIYFYNDTAVFESIVKMYSDNKIMSEAFRKAVSLDSSNTPYYVRIRDGIYSGKNIDCDYEDEHMDRGMIRIEAKALILVPEDLFSM